VQDGEPGDGGSHSVNGVAEPVPEARDASLAPDFYKLIPSASNNKTNGEAPRRWLHANRPLAALITRARSATAARPRTSARSSSCPRTTRLLEKLDAVKRRNKSALARVAKELTGVTVDPLSMFDVQVKRIHEYKRQLLNALHVIHRYWAIVEDGEIRAQPRTVIFAGKAAPGYWMAKLIIKLIHSIGEVVNADRARASTYA
jgi:starch phosphorylase